MKMSSPLIPPCTLTGGDENSVCLFSLIQGLALLLRRESTCFGVGSSGGAAAPAGGASFQLDPTSLRGREAGGGPAIISVVNEQMPSQDRQFTGNGDNGDLRSTTSAQALVEGM